MPSCWRWSVASAGDEATLLAGVEGVRVPAVAFEGLFAGSRRWADSTSASGSSAAVVAVGVSGVAGGFLPCHGVSGAFGSTFGAGSWAAFRRRCLGLLHRAVGPVADTPSAGSGVETGQTQQSLRSDLADWLGTGRDRSGSLGRGRLPTLSSGAGPTPSSDRP